MIDVAGNRRRREAERKELLASRKLNKGLKALADAWDKAAEHYEAEAKEQPTIYMQGVREGASYKLESCAVELRALIKEMGL